MPRRFPPPWSIEESSACFIVRDHDTQALAYVYFENEPGRRLSAKVLTRDPFRGVWNYPSSERLARVLGVISAA